MTTTTGTQTEKGGRAWECSRTFYVQLSAKGAQQLNAEIDKTGGTLKKAEEAGKKFEDTISNAFLAATAGVTAFVAKGLQGTVQGERMAVAFQVLAETIASIFLPAIEMITSAIAKLAGWLDKLGSEGQAAILGFGAAVATAMALATGGITAVITAIALLAGAIGLATGKVQGMGQGNRVKPVQQAGQFEKPEDTFKRMQMAAAGGGKDTQEAMLQELRQIVQNTGKGGDLHRAFKDQPPAVA